LARALAWLGAKVIIAEIAETGAEAEALIRSEGGMALFVQTDVGDEKSIQALAKTVFDAFGLTQVRFVFDRTRMGVVVLDDIGFRD